MLTTTNISLRKLHSERRKLNWLGFLAFLICGCDLGSNSGEKLISLEQGKVSIGNLDCNLKVIISRTDEVVAILVFRNRSDDAMALSQRILVSEGSLTWSAFQVTGPQGKIQYSGKTVKMSPAAESWQTIEPGKFFETTVILSNDYDFSSKGEYSIQYDALISVRDSDELLPLSSQVFSLVR